MVTLLEDRLNVGSLQIKMKRWRILKDKISLNEAAHYLDKLKTYSLQRQNKVFSNSVLKLVNQLENMIFTEPKDYKQTCLDFYLNR